ARGVVLLASASAGLAVGEYHPATVKTAVVGTGGAEKRQIQAMMAVLLPGAKLAGPDAADALAVAICHAHHVASAQGMMRRGRLESTGIDHAVIDVGGVGYLVGASSRTLAAIGPVGEAATLFTEMLVGEDFIRLVGFASAGERDWFRLLTGVQGVGARVALAILSGMSVAELSQAVTLQETGRLVKVPGIGKKTAERLLLELKGKLGADIGMVAGAARDDAQVDVLNALAALGYSDKEALLAIKNMPAGSSVSDGI
ncbi:hypothetical protein LTR94_029189, partial [Friedmanniomyces endolithicus]